jgi:hypothetical protein
MLLNKYKSPTPIEVLKKSKILLFKFGEKMSNMSNISNSLAIQEF